MKAEDLVTVGEADRRIFGADRHEILRMGASTIARVCMDCLEFGRA